MATVDSKKEAARLYAVERVLLTIPGILAGIAVPLGEHRHGHTIGAYVVVRTGLHLGADQILETCCRHLGVTHSPSVVVFGNDVPLLPNGTVDRAALKSRFA